ncbi:MAG: hypothetical protein ABIZ04_06805 [Opitutus sp.]
MNWVLLASGVLYVVGCCLPALEFRDGKNVPDIMFGLRALAVGWSGLFAGVMAWYANPIWLFGVIAMAFRRPFPAVLAGVAAIAIALLTYSAVGRELPGDEGNVTKTTIVSVLPGFYFWLGSLVLLPLAAVFHRFAR